MAEELSQNDIDNLLDGEELNDVTNDSGESPAKIKEETREFFDLLNGSIEDVLKTAFSLEVVSKFIDLKIESKKEINFEDKVFVDIAIQKKNTVSSIVVLMNKRFASILSDLMLMGPGEAKDNLENDDLDALKELFSQICGNFSTNIKENMGISLDFEVRDVVLDAIDTEDELYKATYDIAIPNIEDGTFIVLSSKLIDDFFSEEFGKETEVETEEIPFKEVEEETRNSFKESDLEDRSTTIQETPKNLDLIMDIDLEVKIRIGEKYMLIKDILDLKDGSIIELEKNIEEPMDILVNGKIVAKGVVVVVGGRFGVKITHIETKEERIKSLGG